MQSIHSSRDSESTENDNNRYMMDSKCSIRFVSSLNGSSSHLGSSNDPKGGVDSQGGSSTPFLTTGGDHKYPPSPLESFGGYVREVMIIKYHHDL